MTLKKRFEQYENDYLDFGSVILPRCPRPDICALLLLHELQPMSRCIIGSAEYEQIYLAVDPDALALVVTDEQIRDLVRCGVLYDEVTGGLTMFV